MCRNTVQITVKNGETLTRGGLGHRFSSTPPLSVKTILENQKWLTYKNIKLICKIICRYAQIVQNLTLNKTPNTIYSNCKLNACGFNPPTLRLIHDYLSHRKQRSRVNNSYCEWYSIIFGVPPSSIFWPLLFNISLADLFFIHSDIDIANSADDNTPYLSAKIVEDVVGSLERASVPLFNGLKTTFWKVMLINANFWWALTEK